MNAQEIQHMMETNELSLADALVIAELRRRDLLEAQLRGKLVALESNSEDVEELKKELDNLSMELEQLHKGCMSAFPTCGCQDRIKGLECEVQRLKGELEKPSPDKVSPSEFFELLEPGIHECANQLIEAKKLIETLERQVAVRDREIETLNLSLSKSRAELDRASVTNNGLADRLKEAQDNLNAMYVSGQRRCEDALRVPHIYSTSEGQCVMSQEERIENLEAKLRDRDATIHELTTELETLRARHESDLKTITELNAELTELKSKNSTLRKRFAARD